MPARATVKAATGARVASKAASSREGASTIPIPEEGVDNPLRSRICTIFAEAQRSAASHRNLVVKLRKIQELCCYEQSTPSQDALARGDFDEDNFSDEIIRCIFRVLQVRKAEPAGDRIVRFLGTFLNTASQKDHELLESADAETLLISETPTNRLAAKAIETMLPLMTAKDKIVRFRSTQITSHIVNSMDTLDDQMFHTLRLALLKRIHDKEASVRLQAVYGLGRLAGDSGGNEGEEDSSGFEDEKSTGVLIKLLEALQHDPSAEVRRNLLLNLPLTKDVLPYLLERARDEDASTRRALYSRLLPALGDFRHLSLAHREKLLRWGFRDRDEDVRKATARLFRERWIEDCAALPSSGSGSGQKDDNLPSTTVQAADPSLDALLELLERIDVVNSGVEGGIALEAMSDFWSGRPDYVNYVSFPDDFWNDLSPEFAFVARTFNDSCRAFKFQQRDDMLEEKLPEVTKFAFLLQRELQRLIEVINQSFDDNDNDVSEEVAQREFVVEQMLHMALTFDYSDEVGRQKMFKLMREALATPDLPEEATRLAVEVLRSVCGEGARGEREFCGVVLEAIAEVHDTIMADETIERSISVDESFHSANSQVDNMSLPESGNGLLHKQKPSTQAANADGVDEENAIREIVVNMKCLHIALCMLQNVQCALEENVHLVTMLNNLVVPAVRSQDAPIRERGLYCLGLCCLLGKSLAAENLTLFLHCFHKGHAALQSIAVQIIADILMTHSSLLTEEDAQNAFDANNIAKQVLKVLSKALKSNDPAVQSTGATALAKAMLSQLIVDTDILKQLVIAYFDPEMSSNVHLRQCLAYFLPVYCHTSPENACRMATIVPSIINKLTTLREALLESEDIGSDGEAEGSTMIGVNSVTQMLVDWTDPRKIIGYDECAIAQQNENTPTGPHFLLAEITLERLVTSQTSKDERKTLISMLGRLQLPEHGCSAGKAKTILELVAEATDARLAIDAASRNALSKLQTQLLKCLHDTASAEQGGSNAASEAAIDATGLTASSRGTADVVAPMNVADVSESTLGITTIDPPDAECTLMDLNGNHDTTMDSEMTGI